METILVSACLLGVNVKYNGGNNLNTKILDLVRDKKVILICPEVMGGLATPRKPSEINGNKVIMNDGTDVTDNYVRGAYEVLELAHKFNAHKAILKSKSPSCGVGNIYDGSFTSNLVNGYGICAKLLMDNGIQVINSDVLGD